MRPSELINLSVFKYTTSNLRKKALIKSMLDTIMKNHPVCFALSIYTKKQAKRFLNELVNCNLIDPQTVLEDCHCTCIQVM